MRYIPYSIIEDAISVPVAALLFDCAEQGLHSGIKRYNISMTQNAHGTAMLAPTELRKLHYLMYRKSNPKKESSPSKKFRNRNYDFEMQEISDLQQLLTP